MKAPSFSWYPKDCDTDENVRAMDDREFGFYIRCLNHSWLNHGLPSDLSELARVMNRPKTYVARIWERVGRCFEECEGRLFNPRQEDQRKAQSNYSKHMSKAGKDGAAKRWAGHSHPNGKAKQKPMALDGFAFAFADKTNNSSETTEGDPEVVIRSKPAFCSDETLTPLRDLYEQARYPGIDEDWIDAHGFAWRTLDWEQKQARIAAAKARIDAGAWNDPKFIPKPRKFIEQEWKRPLPAAAKKPNEQPSISSSLPIW